MKPLEAATIEEMKKIVDAKTNKEIPEGSILKFLKSSKSLKIEYQAFIYPTVALYLEAGGGKEHFHVNGIHTTPVDLFEQWVFICEGIKDVGINDEKITKDIEIAPCFIYSENDSVDGSNGLANDGSNLDNIKKKHPACHTLCNLIDKDKVASISAHSNGTFLSIAAMLIADPGKVKDIPYYPFAPAFDDEILKKFLPTSDRSANFSPNEPRTLHADSTLFMNVNDLLNKTLKDKVIDKISERSNLSKNVLDIAIYAMTFVKITTGPVGSVVITVVQVAAAVHQAIVDNTKAIYKEWGNRGLKKIMLVDNCEEIVSTHHDLITHYAAAILSVFYKIELSRGEHKVKASYLPDSEGGGNKSRIANAKGVNKALATNETGVGKALAAANDVGGAI